MMEPAEAEIASVSVSDQKQAVLKHGPDDLPSKEFGKSNAEEIIKKEQSTKMMADL